MPFTHLYPISGSVTCFFCRRFPHSTWRSLRRSKHKSKHISRTMPPTTPTRRHSVKYASCWSRYCKSMEQLLQVNGAVTPSQCPVTALLQI